MKKFTYPKVSVITLNAAESVMRTLNYSGEPTAVPTNVLEHKYTGKDYTYWDRANITE